MGVAQNHEAAQYLALHGKILAVLTELLMEKQDDDDMIMQLLFAFECMSLQDEIREYFLRDESELIPYIIDLMRDRSPIVKQQASRTLDTISTLAKAAGAGSFAAWQERIRALKFDVYNQAWLMEVRNEAYGAYSDGSQSPGGWDVENSLGAGLQWDIDAVLRERDWTGEEGVG